MGSINHKVSLRPLSILESEATEWIILEHKCIISENTYDFVNKIWFCVVANKSRYRARQGVWLYWHKQYWKWNHVPFRGGYRVPRNGPIRRRGDATSTATISGLYAVIPQFIPCSCLKQTPFSSERDIGTSTWCFSISLAFSIRELLNSSARLSVACCFRIDWLEWRLEFDFRSPTSWQLTFEGWECFI